jgi:hypothetical protein
MSTSFENKKRLRFVITLATGTFGSSNNNQITLEGYRSIAEIDKAGGMMMGELRARIFGVSQSDMNSCTLIQFKPGFYLKNTIVVFAIDGDSETMVFAGNVVNAWGDYQDLPQVCLYVQAQSAYSDSLSSAVPFSIPGAIDVSIPMSQLAAKMGLSFENNNVHTIVRDIYLPNTLKEQALDLAREAGCSLYIDDTTLAITPLYQPRGSNIPEISPSSGLVGYPTFDGVGGISFRTLFNPSILFGGAIKLVTSIPQAEGQWLVACVSHHLEAEKPNGEWFSRIRGNKIGITLIQ